MTEHQLTNTRPIPNRDATCGWCLRPLYQIMDLNEIITPRRGGPTFCCDLCWSEWVVNDKPDADTEVPYIINAHTPRAARASSSSSPSRKPPKTIAEINRNGAKSAARQTGEAAANVVGFALYLIIISAIAAALFAACGIATM